MQIIGIIAGVVIGGIVIMVLLNKLLDYLSDRFPIGYNVVNILFFGVAFILAFVYWGADEGSRLSSGVMCGVMHFISLYYCLPMLRRKTLPSIKSKAIINLIFFRMTNG